MKLLRRSCDPQPGDQPGTILGTDVIIEELLLQTRRIPLVGEIDEVSSTVICSYLQLFALENKPIYMYINSPGGCLLSGYAIIDQMLATPCKIYTIVRGHAYSMGAIIAAFGTKGCRFITPNSSMMIHSLIVQNPPGPIEEQEGLMKHIREDYDRFLVIFSKKLKVSVAKLGMMMKENTWLDTKGAMKLGIVDGIWTPKMERAINEVVRHDDK